MREAGREDAHLATRHGLLAGRLRLRAGHLPEHKGVWFRAQARQLARFVLLLIFSVRPPPNHLAVVVCVTAALEGVLVELPGGSRTGTCVDVSKLRGRGATAEGPQKEKAPTFGFFFVVFFGLFALAAAFFVWDSERASEATRTTASTRAGPATSSPRSHDNDVDQPRSGFWRVDANQEASGLRTMMEAWWVGLVTTVFLTAVFLAAGVVFFLAAGILKTARQCHTIVFIKRVLSMENSSHLRLE